MKTKNCGGSLVALLLVTVLPGCVARHMLDWSNVQAVVPETKTEVHLFKDSAPQGARKITGRFLSTTDDSVTLKLKDGQTETFQKKDVHKVRIRRPFGKRWQGWVTLGISALIVGQLGNLDGPESNRLYFQLLTTGPLATAVFFGTPMGGVYEVPPEHRGWRHPQGASSPTEEAKNSK